MEWNWTVLNPLLRAIEMAMAANQSLLKCVTVGIDGRCGAGKSTLARVLCEHFSEASVIAMDDFFLPPEMRAQKHMAIASGEGNADFERFLLGVAPYLRNSAGFSYRRFDCTAQDYAPEPVCVPTGRLRIVEGSYSLHPSLRGLYDGMVFCDIDAETQRTRLLSREGTEGFLRFEEHWIPLEEVYFSRYGVREIAQFVVM